MTGIATNKEGLIKSKESITKNNMVTRQRESRLTFRTCLVHHHFQMRMNQIHFYKIFYLTVSVQDHFWVLTLKGLKVLLYPSCKKLFKVIKPTLDQLLVTLFQCYFTEWNRFYWVGKNFHKQ